MEGNNNDDLQQKTEAIDSNLLIRFGAVFKNYNKGEIIFKEGEHPHFYHQVIKGKIKIINETDDGKQFIQDFFSSGESFGEPAIFEGGDYPADAIADQSSTVIRLSIPSFIQLLKDNFDIHWNITKLISKRLKRKVDFLKEICFHSPEQRILSLLKNHKKEKLNNSPGIQKVKIDYTRKHIADMTGLRVETVIRIMRNLYKRKIISIERGKVFY